MSYGLRVAVIDSDSYTREARLLLLQSQPDIQVVFDSADPAAALEALPDYLVDVVVLDARVPGFTIDKYVQSLSDAFTTAGNSGRILVTANFITPAFEFACLSAGASAVVDGDRGAAAMLASLRKTATNEVTLDTAAIQTIFQSLPSLPAPQANLALAIEKMDENQLEVLRLLLEGKTDTQISKDLGLTKYRVTKFIDTLTLSSGFRTRNQLCIELVALGKL